jgi:RNA polymerase sigma-70 factor (ECF subfamily)
MAMQLEELERIYRDRYAAFLGVARSVTGNREQAREVVQEGFARALRSRSTFKGQGTLDSWLWQIVVHAALDARAAETPGLSLEDCWEGTAEQPLPFPERDPALASALRRLPPRRRLIVFLRYFADLSYDEIAHACDISVGTVSASLTQARSELLDSLTVKEMDR